MRVTMVVRNLDGLKARLKAKSRAARERLRLEAIHQGEETWQRAFEDCPRDTEFMAQQLTLTFTRDGFNWSIGFFAKDFIGQLNPVTRQIVKDFYAPFPILGTRFQTGHDFLSAALRARKREIRAAYAKALKG